MGNLVVQAGSHKQVGVHLVLQPGLLLGYSRILSTFETLAIILPFPIFSLPAKQPSALSSPALREQGGKWG